jgi:hypothetical protein
MRHHPAFVSWPLAWKRVEPTESIHPSSEELKKFSGIFSAKGTAFRVTASLLYERRQEGSAML